MYDGAQTLCRWKKEKRVGEEVNKSVRPWYNFGSYY